MPTLLVNNGRAIVTNRIKNGATGATEPNFVAWGTGAGTTAQADSSLFTETGSRVSGTSTQQTTSTTNDTYQVIGTQTAGGSLAITNAGLFDASTAGNLFVKGDFSTINLASGDSIQFTFRTQFS